MRDPESGEGYRAKSRGVRILCAGWPDRSRPSGGARGSVGHRIRAVCDHAVRAGVGVRELLPAGRAAAARCLRGAGAGLHRDPDRAVAFQVRNSAADADVPRLPDHRPRYVLVSALGVSAVADAVDRGRPRCGSTVVADLAFRSVPRAPPPCADRRWPRAPR